MKPTNLAHALAGLPQIGWEQSFSEREAGKPVWPSRTYQVFWDDRKCADESPDRFRSALEDVIERSRIETRRTPLQAIAVPNWRYFRMAIEKPLRLRTSLSVVRTHILRRTGGSRLKAET